MEAVTSVSVKNLAAESGVKTLQQHHAALALSFFFFAPFFLLHRQMSKRPAPNKQPQYEETSSDEDEQPKQPPKKAAAALKFGKPKGATPKDQDGKTMEWNGEAGQWESYDQHGEVTYFRLPKSAAAPDQTPKKPATATPAAAVDAVVVPADVVESLGDAADEDEFVTKLKKQQRKIRKKADKEIAAIDQLIADHGEEQELKKRLAALEAAKQKYGGSSSADAE